MQKSISVFSVATPEKTVSFPSKATANKALETLQAFGIVAELKVEKKVFNLTEVEEPTSEGKEKKSK